MTPRTRLPALLLGTLLCLTASCVYTEPGEGMRNEGPIPGITNGVDGPEQVEKTLGKPSAKANGWWQDEHRFDMDFRVWYYAGVGRVVFRRDTSMVYTTEADKTQGVHPN
jgi:hypothetical protein